MDVKVYQKEEVLQPSGYAEVITPNIIDIIPDLIEVESDYSIRDNTWTLDYLKKIADVRIEGNRLIINSDKVRYENGNLYVTLTADQVLNCETVTGKDEREQACALATIFQRGLDPLDLNDGVQWSETLLGEVNALQLMEQITNAVSQVATNVKVEFSTVVTDSGQSVLTYSLREVA